MVLTVTDSESPAVQLTQTVQLVISRQQSGISLGCSPSAVTVGSVALCTATVTGYQPTGFVTFQDLGGSGKATVPSSCLLTPSFGASSCSVSVSSGGAGTVEIQASYPGDTNNNFPPGPADTTLVISKGTSITNVVCTPSTVQAGQQTSCAATVTGFHPTGTISWQSSDSLGVFSANPCTLAVESALTSQCSVTYTVSTLAAITATYSGDFNNTGSEGTFAIAATVSEQIQLTVANSGPATAVSLSGCSVSPTSINADGTPHSFVATSGCSGVTITLPTPGPNQRYLTSTGASTLSVGSCASSSCAIFEATIYYQTQNTYGATPASPSAWTTAGQIDVTGTELGSAAKTICTISVSTGTGTFTCVGWTDYSTPATLSVLQVSQDQRWATAQSSFTDTSGGSTHSSAYYLQVLEDFGYSLVGSPTAPSAPTLTYTGFGSTATLPLTGSESLVWLDTGTAWTVPTTLTGSTSGERWATSVDAGAATAGQTVTITYYHQFLETFVFSISGGGTTYQPPTVTSTSFGQPQKSSQGWVDAGTGYAYTNPLSGSTATERWISSADSGVVSASATINETYFHQYAFTFNFTVLGGGSFDNPRLNFTTLGVSGAEPLNETSAVIWVDAGDKWGVSTLLPNSSPSERWITKQATAGVASAPLVDVLTYYHQYLGTLSYSIQGSGGTPPVPNVNYTSLGARFSAPINKTGGGYWIDSGSTWGVPLTMPGLQGERWLSNLTQSVQVTGTFRNDIRYAHQFYVEVGVNTHAGGGVSNSNGWVDQNVAVILNASAVKGWTFSFWQGATPYSYNGTQRFPTLTVAGPANETAMFAPGLTITTDHQGSVAYSYGSITGTVPAGSNTTIFPPLGKDVSLTALPQSVEVNFVGWTGALTQTSVQSSVSIDAPSLVHASFATDYTDIRTFAIASLVIFILAAYVFVIRRGFTPKIGRPLGSLR